MSTEEETLDNAFKELGDISGLTVFDVGTEGIAAKYLAERIGDGRVVGANFWLGTFERTRKKVGDELMEKIVFIKDDLRRIDYLKDNFFDLVVSYETLESVEGMNPGATLPILHQLYRILKSGRWFLAIEHPSLLEVVPINKAQELNLQYLKILYHLWGDEWGIGTYRPSQFSDILRRIGFEDIKWKTVSQAQRITDDMVTEMFQGIRNLANKRINEGKAKESVLKEIDDISQEGEKIGFCEPPHYAIYARKPSIDLNRELAAS